MTENGSANSSDIDGVNYEQFSVTLEKSTKEKNNGGSSSAGGHRRSVSGNLLSRLPFLRPTQDRGEREPASPQPNGDLDFPDSPVSPKGAGAMALALQQKKTRKRKGSLRKVALLSTGKLRLEGREHRRSSLEQVKNLQDEQGKDTDAPEFTDCTLSPQSLGLSEDLPTPRAFHQPSRTFFPSKSVSVSQVEDGDRGKLVQASGRTKSGIALISSPTLGDTSTTDEEDVIQAPHVLPTGHASTILKKPSAATSDSYFPPQPSLLQRKRSNNRTKSPLASSTIETVLTSEEWDYSDTEWWGWVVLIVTWIVFVVGMGSCFGVWSWAWDVGETPYAPPELEDDPTLPIVGYYPALIILTTVMAWVWVVVAWMGMKYFKHAKISGEDS